MGLHSHLVEVCARQVPLLGDHLRGHTLVDQFAVVAVDHHRPERSVAALAVGEHRDARHGLDTTCDDDVVVPRDDTGGGEVQRLLAGAALAVDCGAGHSLREAGGQGRVASDVEALLPHLGDAAPDHIVDECRVDARTLYKTLQRKCGQIHGMDPGQGTLLGLAHSDRCADSGDDDGISVGHGPDVTGQ